MLFHLFLVVVAEVLVFQVSSTESTRFEVVQAVVRVRHLRGRVRGCVEVGLALFGQVCDGLRCGQAARVGSTGLLRGSVVALFVALRVLVLPRPGPLRDILDFFLRAHHGLRSVFLYVARRELAAPEVPGGQVGEVLVEIQSGADLVLLGFAHRRVLFFVLLDFGHAGLDRLFIFLELGFVGLDLLFERSLFGGRAGGLRGARDCASRAVDGSSDELLDDGGEQRLGRVSVADVEFVDWMSGGLPSACLSVVAL